MSVTIRSLRGVGRLAFDGLGGLTSVVEQMHETIARRPAPWSRSSADPRATHAHGPIAVAVYAAIRGVEAVLAEGLERSLAVLGDAPGAPRHADVPTAAVAALNGVCGDYLEDTGNPLAIPMTFTTPGHELEPTPDALARTLSGASSRIVLLVHGLGLSERCWRRRGRPCLGERLRDERGFTPVYLRYNTGRHVSTNGRELAEALERLVAAWPMPVSSLVLVGHSMGGLVIRSACRYGEQEGRAWLDRLTHAVYLGTPHHGSPLEKGGHLLDRLLRISPYSAPLALGRLRSAGIRDLRHGDLLHEDWQGREAGRPAPDSRPPVPLAVGVEHCFAAATIGRRPSDLRGRLLGDLLVRAGSAVGTRVAGSETAPVRSERRRIFHSMNHFDLLDHPAVQRQVVEWLDSAPPRGGAVR
jgi:pimeloyl-ACP methyl ester carboxylesterase